MYHCPQARQKDATAGEHRLGEQMALSLQKIITPYFLRRTKAEIKSKECVEKQRRESEGSDSACNGENEKQGEGKSAPKFVPLLVLKDPLDFVNITHSFLCNAPSFNFYILCSQWSRVRYWKAPAEYTNFEQKKDAQAFSSLGKNISENYFTKCILQ